MQLLHEKIAEANRIIGLVDRNYKRPALLWSAGKDSMVMLWLLRNRSMRWPVVFWRQPWRPIKYDWANHIIVREGLEVWDWAPYRVTAQTANGQLELVNHYMLGQTESGDAATAAVPYNFYEPRHAPKGWEPVVCGLEWLRRPRGTFVAPWDCFLHGHKSADVDRMLGPVPIESDIRQTPQAMPDFAFPLRQWTDEDIWEYTRAFDVPVQLTRYDPITGKELPQKERNPDWWACCTRCLDPAQPAAVDCPKLNCKVSNVSKDVPFHPPLKPDY